MNIGNQKGKDHLMTLRCLCKLMYRYRLKFVVENCNMYHVDK